MNRNNEIPVFFTVDERYAGLCAVAIHSLIANSSPDRRYRIVVLHDHVSPASQSLIKRMATENVSIEFREMQQSFDGITGRIGDCLRADYFTLTIYYRLFIPEMFPEYDKGIYIDSDVVLNADIAELFDKELGSNLIGASPDWSVQNVPPLCRYIEEAIGVPHAEYINSGILLMNLAELRHVELGKRFLQLLNQYHFDCIAPDQDYLNALCRGRILFLGEEWDAMPKDYGEPLAEPKLVHYNLFCKPWMYDGIWYADLFWHYADGAGLGTPFRQFKAAYTDEQKASDSRCLNYLCERGANIPDQDVTFKKIFNTGIEPRL